MMMKQYKDKLSINKKSRSTLISFALVIAGVSLLSNPAMFVQASENKNHVHSAEHSEHQHVSQAKAYQQENSQNHEHDGQHADKTKFHQQTTAEMHAEDQVVNLSSEQMAIAGIEVAAVTPRLFVENLYAPGEIKANGYKSYIVSPRTESVIVARHARLGQHVEKGEALVTLFSESVAQAQADYRVAYNDWQRNSKLGRTSVSESALLSSETDYMAAFSRLQAYGLTESAIKKIVQNNSSKLGEYTLIAQRSGAVLNDNFSQGQRVSAGEQIMTLADESLLWVEARVSPNKDFSLPVGTKAIIDLSGQLFEAKVIQEAHTIDAVTRTRIVRLEVSNSHDRLHPGMFVNVNFQFKTDTKVMAVPESALMRSSDGDWLVFVEDHPGEFKAIEVELGRSLGAYREIIGIAANTRLVTHGAFFVASEIAKGGFDPHNH